MIVISPFSRTLKNGAKNPKNYPYWEELISMIKESFPNETICQAVDKDEARLKGAKTFVKTNLKTLPKFLASAKLVLSVDNFMPHLCHYYSIQKCIVVFGQSDPRIYGWKEYLNLCLDEQYLMPNQFASWEEATYKEEAFPKPEFIFGIIKDILS